MPGPLGILALAALGAVVLDKATPPSRPSHAYKHALYSRPVNRQTGRTTRRTYGV